MYHVGDRVKVFMDCFSLHTEPGIISYVEFIPDKNEFIYLVTLDNGTGDIAAGEESILKGDSNDGL